MADLKLVGAVAIKVRPDADGFKQDTEKQIKQELRNVKGTVPIEAELTGEEQVKRDADKLEKEMEGRKVSWQVKLDHDSVQAAQKQFASILEPTQKISFEIGDDESIAQAAADLAEMAELAQVKITYFEDEKGYKSVLDKIAKLRREKLEKTISWDTDEAALAELEQDMLDKLAALNPEATVDLTERVLIEYQEDREGFQAAINRINAELRKLDTLTLDVELSREELLAARDVMQEEMDKQPLLFKYTEDEAGYKKILKQIKDLQDQSAQVDIDLNLDDFELAKTAAEIQAKLDALNPEVHVNETVNITYHEDREGFEAAIKAINAELRKLEALSLTVDLDREELLAARDLMQEELDRAPMKFKYDRNPAGLMKVIEEIDKQLNRVEQVEIETTLDPLNLSITKAQLEAELSEMTMKIEYDEGLASLKAAKAKIEKLLHIEPLSIETKLDEASLTAALARVNAMIEAHEESKIKPKVEPKVSTPDYLKAMAQIGTLGKSQTVDIFVKLDNAGVLATAAKLTGLRAASRWTEGFARTLGSLDRNLPIVAAAVVGLSTLSSGMLGLTANALTLSTGLGQVVRSAGLLAPALMMGFAAVKTVYQGVFKDFGAAVNGDDKAIEKLTESGKKAAASVRVVFQEIRELVSKNFWDEASDGMLRFSEMALPEVRDGLGLLSTSLGKVFENILDSTSAFAKADGFTVFFANLVRGMGHVSQGVGPFMRAFLTLGTLGSTIFPRLGKAFEQWAGRFDSWVKELSVDGTFNRWIDQGIQGMKDMWNAGSDLIGVWNNIAMAAQAAGGMTLHSLAQWSARLEDVTAGDRFQRNVKLIFEGAREASDSFHDALGDLGPAMDVFSLTVSNSLANAGAALGSFIALLGDVMASPRLDVGMTAFLTGVKVMFEELRPAAAPITEILQTFGEILGTVARDSGPLFRNLFQQIATVLTVAWSALEPFLPALIQVGSTIVNTLGPALAAAATNLIPAFANGLVSIGEGLTPVIAVLGVFAQMMSKWVSDIPLPVIAGLVTGVLALTGAFQFSAAVLPVVGAALEAFGVTAALTGLRLQLMIPVVGIVLAALTGLAIGGVAALASGMSSATPFANEYETALREDAKAADDLADAIGGATTKLAIKKLVDAGAYDAASKLGIGTKEVTEAVLKGGSAWDAIKGKISGVNDTYANQADVIAATGGSVIELSDHMDGQKKAADTLNKALDENRGSLEAAKQSNEMYAEAARIAGIETEDEADAQKKLEEQTKKTSAQLGAAAQASAILTDAFSSSQAKVDAMRKTFEILVGKDAKQQAAETLGAYASGFNTLKETVAPVAQSMRDLGDAAYGENGFLNVAGGNKAVLQVNQALVDQVNNVWAGAKAAYDAAIAQGDNAATAFQKAQEFITTHKGDYDSLAEASGVSAEKVQGQWEAVFGKEWVLKVSLQGATEAAATAQALIQSIKGQFDGQKFMAWLDANPDMAMLAISEPTAAAQAYVDHTWQAELDALPEAAQNKLRELVGMTEEQWNRGDFSAVMKAAKEIPGLAENIVAIRNGASNNGQDWQAVLYAALNGISVDQAKAALDAIAESPRTAYINSVILPPNQRSMDLFLAQNGGGGAYNGAILNGSGRGQHGFSMGPIKYFANGGIERHVAQIASGRGPVRVWGEKETHGEAYIPYSKAKRPRSLAILNQVARDFGYSLTKSNEYANGGFAGHAGPSPTTNNSANVHIGTLNTVNPDEAVRKIRNSQQDALAVAGITLNGA